MSVFKSAGVLRVFMIPMEAVCAGAGSVRYEAEHLFENAGDSLLFPASSDAVKESFK